MQNRVHREVIPVAKGDLLSLGETHPVEIECESGLLWITQDNDIRDVVLSAGERFTSDRATRVLVHALRPTTLTATTHIRPMPSLSLASGLAYLSRRIAASIESRQPVAHWF